MLNPTIPNMDIRRSAAAIQAQYREQVQTPAARMLIISRKGAGKTSLLQTCRKPVLLDMWDPSGEQVLWDDSGRLPSWCFCRPWYGKDPKQSIPEWNRAIQQDRKSGLLNLFGTYCLDSVTQWAEARLECLSGSPQVMSKGGEEDGLKMYRLFKNEVGYYAKVANSFPCDVIWLGHLRREIIGDTGKIIYKVLIDGQSDDRLPTIFSESYVMEADAKPPTLPASMTAQAGAKAGERFKCADGLYRWLRTKQDGMYDCSTRLGRPNDKGVSKWDAIEPASIEAIKRKSGIYAEDLPAILDNECEGEAPK